jgi:Low affinity iron permease
VLWVPTLWVLRSVDTWQLVINTVTTIITFLLVALLQNTQSRARQAVQQKLNALADGLWDLMGELGDERPELRRHRRLTWIAASHSHGVHSPRFGTRG